MFVVAAASSDELHYLQKKVVPVQQKRYSGILFLRARLNGKNILIVQTGVGPKKAGFAGRQIIKSHVPSCVLSIGAAGAVDERLQVGDVVVIENVLQSTGQSIQCDEGLREEAIRKITNSGLRPTLGNCLTVNRFIHLKEEKKKIHDTTGAKVVDMESAAIARAVFSAGTPFFDVRIVSDTARADTVDLVGLFQQRKKRGLYGATRYFFKRPSEVMKAIRLKRNIVRVASLISDIVEIPV